MLLGISAHHALHSKCAQPTSGQPTDPEHAAAPPFHCIQGCARPHSSRAPRGKRTGVHNGFMEMHGCMHYYDTHCMDALAWSHTSALI